MILYFHIGASYLSKQIARFRSAEYFYSSKHSSSLLSPTLNISGYSPCLLHYHQKWHIICSRIRSRSIMRSTLHQCKISNIHLYHFGWAWSPSASHPYTDVHQVCCWHCKWHCKAKSSQCSIYEVILDKRPFQTGSLPCSLTTGQLLFHQIIQAIPSDSLIIGT